MNTFFLYFLIILLPNDTGHIQLSMSSMIECKKMLQQFEDAPDGAYCTEIIKQDLTL